MSLVTLPRAGMPLVGNSAMSREWYRWAHDITQRVGGVTGAGTDDLSLSQFEDAGIEEAKQAQFRLADEVGQIPAMHVHQAPEDLETQINALREAVAVLAQTIRDMQEGQQP